MNATAGSRSMVTCAKRGEPRPIFISLLKGGKGPSRTVATHCGKEFCWLVWYRAERGRKGQIKELRRHIGADEKCPGTQWPGNGQSANGSIRGFGKGREGRNESGKNVETSGIRGFREHSVGRVPGNAEGSGRCDGVFIGGCFPGSVHTSGAAIRRGSRAFLLWRG